MRDCRNMGRILPIIGVEILFCQQLTADRTSDSTRIELFVAVALDERFCHLQADIVLELLGRRFEEVG